MFSSLPLVRWWKLFPKLGPPPSHTNVASRGTLWVHWSNIVKGRGEEWWTSPKNWLDPKKSTFMKSHLDKIRRNKSDWRAVLFRIKWWKANLQLALQVAWLPWQDGRITTPWYKIFVFLHVCYHFINILHRIAAGRCNAGQSYYEQCFQIPLSTQNFRKQHSI